MKQVTYCCVRLRSLDFRPGAAALCSSERKRNKYKQQQEACW